MNNATEMIYPASTKLEQEYGLEFSFWDGDNISMELDVNNKPIRRYLYGVGMDDVEGHFEYAENTGNPFTSDMKGWYPYIKDQVGTIYKVISHERKQVAETRTVDTFGNLINRTGTSNANLGFQSKYYDSESGLYYYYLRYYNPIIGRFINEDPIGIMSGELNMYRFVSSNPVINSDYFGLVTGGYGLRIQYVTIKEFYKITNRVRYGVTYHNDNNISGECIQLNNGKWYPRFNLTLNADIYISTTERNGTPRPDESIKRTLRHELLHSYHIWENFQSIHDDWFEMETDYENGSLEECKCKAKIKKAISKAKSKLNREALFSQLYVDYFLLIWPFDDVTYLFE